MAGACPNRDIHQLVIPVPHLAARAPERSIHGGEVTELVRAEGILELLSVHAMASSDLELGLKFAVQLMVPLDIVPKVQHNGLLIGRSHASRGAAGVWKARRPEKAGAKSTAVTALRLFIFA
jgi:hypothetical protein